MADQEQLPKAVSQGLFQLPGTNIYVTLYVLEDGRRIVAAEDMEKLLEWLSGDPATDFEQ